MQPIYTFNLNHPVTSGCVTLGYFDGKHPSLTAATSTDKVKNAIFYICYKIKICRFLFIRRIEKLTAKVEGYPAVMRAKN
jgi:hypothetical protein